MASRNPRTTPDTPGAERVPNGPVRLPASVICARHSACARRCRSRRPKAIWRRELAAGATKGVGRRAPISASSSQAVSQLAGYCRRQCGSPAAVSAIATLNPAKVSGWAALLVPLEGC
jgi:hypothetical protein